MQMQDLIDDFHSINYKTTYDNHEEYGWQTHIWYNLSIKVISRGALLFILFDSDCVHIYVNKLISTSQIARGWS
jgi:hypothetical protein